MSLITPTTVHHGLDVSFFLKLAMLKRRPMASPIRPVGTSCAFVDDCHRLFAGVFVFREVTSTY